MSARLRQTASEVISSVEAIRSAANEISQGSIDLSNRTELQATSLQQTVAVMGEIALTVHANADNSENAHALTAGALDHAEAGSSEQARSIAEVKKALAELDGATQWPRSATEEPVAVAASIPPSRPAVAELTEATDDWRDF